MGSFNKDFKKICKNEIEDYLKQININIKNFNTLDDTNEISNLHRFAHTISTTAKYLEADNVCEIAKCIENVLKKCKTNPEKFDNQLCLDSKYALKYLEDCYIKFIAKEKIDVDEFNKVKDLLDCYLDNSDVNTKVEPKLENQTCFIFDEVQIDDFEQKEDLFVKNSLEGEGTIWKVFVESKNIKSETTSYKQKDNALLKINYNDAILSLSSFIKNIEQLKSDESGKKQVENICEVIKFFDHEFKDKTLVNLYPVLNKIQNTFYKAINVWSAEVVNLFIDIAPLSLENLLQLIESIKNKNESDVDISTIDILIDDFEAELKNISLEGNKIINHIDQEEKVEDNKFKSVISSDLMVQFCHTTKERLLILTNLLLLVEDNNDDKDKFREILSEMHTLKGESKIMRCDDINNIAHYCEDVLKIADNSGNVSVVIDDILKALDSINLLVESIEEGKSNNINADVLCKKLDQIAKDIRENKYSTSTTNKIKPEFTQLDENPLVPVVRAEKRESLRVNLEKLEMVNNLVEDLNIRGSAADYRQKQIEKEDYKITETLKKFISFKKKLFGNKKILKDPDLRWILTEFEEIETVFDDINNNIKQYVVNNEDANFYMNLYLRDLYKHVRSMKMIPISTLFDNYPRAIRDMARETGKKVKISLTGGETELDKNMIEAIKDPMIHLIRNSVDHGIEKPDIRANNDKNEKGNIDIAALQKGSSIIIKIKDDGAGIDKAKVLKKALSAGIVSEQDSVNILEKDVFNLLFTSGFSTKDSTTQFSGRGVGLDVVKRTIEGYEGNLEISSRLGHGTEFSLTIPVSTAVIKAMPFTSKDLTLFIPSIYIGEVMKIERKKLKLVDNINVIKWRGQIVPIINLSNFLNLKGSSIKVDDKISLIIVQYFGKTIGFEVDSFKNERSILLRSLGTLIVNVPYISGTTIMEDGSVALVVNTGAVFDSAYLDKKAEAVRLSTDDVLETKAKKVLIVDDSPIIREVQKAILKSAGFIIDEAENGVEAFNKIRTTSFDVILSDIEMPHMNGLELTKNLKSDKRFSNIPVIIMTTRSTEEDKIKGAEAGCDGYIVKSDFTPELLLDIIKKVIPE